MVVVSESSVEIGGTNGAFHVVRHACDEGSFEGPADLQWSNASYEVEDGVRVPVGAHVVVPSASNDRWDIKVIL